MTPKVAQLDINQIVNGSFVKTLEENGFLPEARKKSDYNYGMECWSNGIVEYWVSLLHHSNSEFATTY